MSDKNDLTVAGFIFNSEADAELARQEVQKIEYLEKRMNYKLPDNMLAVYEKTLENKLLQTPVGWNYLYDMRLKLVTAGIAPKDIPPIPLYGTFAHKIGDDGAGIAKQRIIAPKEKPAGERYRARFFTALAASAVLLVVVIGMFQIALRSNNPNILNYEKVILDKYATWAQELSEREQAVREKEKELNLAE